MISRGHRRELNRALHELRRPLQALALIDGNGVRTEPAPDAARRGLLELACCALTDLDRAVNGGPPMPAPRPVSCRGLIHGCVERWRPLAADRGGIRVFWDAGEAQVECDPARLSRALDNLIANAVEHGGPPFVVTGAAVAGRLRITVANGAPSANGGTAPPASGHSNGTGGGSQSGSRSSPGDGRAREGRRGHGIPVVSEVAADHRGRFAICHTASGSVAALELPLLDGGLARAA